MVAFLEVAELVNVLARSVAPNAKHHKLKSQAMR